MFRYYVGEKTTRLYDSATSRGYSLVMIRGDAVLTDAKAHSDSTDRIAAEFRGRSGFIQQKSLKEVRDLEIYFIDVGQGDAAFIITPRGKSILIDGGLNNRALGFLAWLYRLDLPANSVDIDLLVLSHADSDHIAGLTRVLEHPQINVRRIVQSGIATYRPGAKETALGNCDTTHKFLVTRHDQLSELDPSELTDEFGAWRSAVLKKGCSYMAAGAPGSIVDIGDDGIKIEVLGPCLEQAPSGEPGYRWYDSKSDEPDQTTSKTINGHSVVLRLVYGKVAVLLPGDINALGSENLMLFNAAATKLSSHVLKAPHHGSHDYHPPFLEAVSPQVSVISSGDEPDYGHPRANFLAAVGRASRSPEPLLFATEIAASFVEADNLLPEDAPNDLAGLDFTSPQFNDFARKLFKRRLPGMINVRTDGEALFAARRVDASYQWEAYGPLPAAPPPA